MNDLGGGVAATYSNKGKCMKVYPCSVQYILLDIPKKMDRLLDSRHQANVINHDLKT